jgi:hypothetical protein
MSSNEYTDPRALELATDPDPVHGFFGPSYATHLVIPRVALQSMPVEWQRRFVALLYEAAPMIEHVEPPGGYMVKALDARGKFMRDRFADYERGRRKIVLSKDSAPTGAGGEG